MSPTEIKSMRGALALSQSELARALNIAVFTVQRWETGKNKPTGLPAEVLRGIRAAVGRVSPERAREFGEQLRGGLSAALTSALLAQPNGVAFEERKPAPKPPAPTATKKRAKT